MQFDLPKELSSIIKVIGVGGGGSNAVNHMFKQGIKGVDFIVCNTDQQALDISPVPTKLVLGTTLTKGRGAGSKPEVGKNAAIENIEDVRKLISNNTEMVFITAGMGGGTGTGAAPVIAKVAKEQGILTVGIVTVPFTQEGKKRREQALDGIKEMRDSVDSLIIINNDKLREIYGNLKASQSFAKADDVLSMAAKGIADIITTTLQINTDINDVKTVMTDSGVAIMGTASAIGENRAVRAAEEALSSPLLNDNEIQGARYVLVNITCGSGDNEITMEELGDISDYIQEAAGQSAEVIKGYGIDESLGGNVNVTIIATGFNSKDIQPSELKPKTEKIVRNLMDEVQQEVAKPAIMEITPAIDDVSDERITIEEYPTEKQEPSPLEPFLIIKPVEEQPMKAEEIELEITNLTQVTTTETSNEITETPITITEVVLNETPVAEEITPEPVAEVTEAIESISEPVVAFTEETTTITVAETKEVTVENKTEEITADPVIENPIVAAVTSAETVETFANNILSEEPQAINKQEEVKAEIKVETKSETITTPPVTVVNEEKKDEVTEEQIRNEEQIRKAQERIMKLKELSYKLKTPNGLTELENEPAYKRRNVQLDSTPHSSESQVSKYTLSPEEGNDKKTNIRPNNSFLHDNVD